MPDAPTPPARTPHNRAVTVTLPLPPPELSPNARKDRRAVSETRAGYREHAHLAALQAMKSHRRRWLFTDVVYRFYLPDRRRRDIDNLIAAAKARSLANPAHADWVRTDGRVNKMHHHLHAHRIMEQVFLDDLWTAWQTAVAAPNPDAAAEMAVGTA